MSKANQDGMFGLSDAPEKCLECGSLWANAERLHTGDSNGIGGWEDWTHCAKCGNEAFYPVVRPPATTQEQP